MQAVDTQGMAKNRPPSSVPAFPSPPRYQVGLARALIKPSMLTNLIASFPENWYRDRFSAFRIGISSSGRGVVVNDAEAIRRILVTDAENFPKEDNQLAVLRPLLGRGLLTDQGESWRRKRRLAAPIFQHAAIKEFAPLFVAAAERSAYRALSYKGPFSIDAEMTRVTLDIIGEAVLGCDLEADVESISDTVSSTLDKFPGMFLAGVLLPPSGRDRVIEALVSPGRRSLTRFARKIIKHARDKEIRSSLIGKLMDAAKADSGEDMSLEDVRDEIATFLLAGHETTATTLSWVWYLLSLYPQAQDRIEEEVARVAGDRALTAEDVSSLVYTRAVVDETLRLYPPVANLLRKANETTDIAPGVTVKAGERVLISPWVLHRHQAYWEEPEQFRPERFLDETAGERPRYAYMPFGGGPRVCIGASFSLMEAVLILGTYAQRMKLRVINTDEVMPQARIVMRPSVRLKAETLPRTPKAA